MLRQAVQSVRPYVRIDHPVAQSLGVVAAQMEPAVIEHEAFHADLCSTVGEFSQRGLVVVEVHGLPRVERERTGLDGRVHAARRAAQPGVEAFGHAVESFGGVGEAHFRRGVVFAAGEPDFAGTKQFARADQRLVARQVVDAVGLVAAPRQMAGPHLAFAPFRLAIGGDEHPWAFVAGFAVAAFARDGTGRQRGAADLLFQRPPAGELGEGIDAFGHGERGFEPVHGERFGGVRGVGDGLRDEDEAAVLQREREFKADLVDGVFGRDGDGGAESVGALVGDRRFDRRPAGEHRLAATVRFETGATGEGLGALRQQRRAQGGVRLLLRRRDLQRHRIQLGQQRLALPHAEITTPVLHLRHLVRRRFQHHAHTVALEHHMAALIKHRRSLPPRMHRRTHGQSHHAINLCYDNNSAPLLRGVDFLLRSVYIKRLSKPNGFSKLRWPHGSNEAD